MPSAPNTDIRCVLVVGADAMGQQIGLQCALHGHEAIVYDIAPEALEAERSGQCLCRAIGRSIAPDPGRIKRRFGTHALHDQPGRCRAGRPGQRVRS